MKKRNDTWWKKWSKMIFGVFFNIFGANFLGNGNGSKWIAGRQATNAIGLKWQGSELSWQSTAISRERDHEPWVKNF